MRRRAACTSTMPLGRQTSVYVRVVPGQDQETQPTVAGKKMADAPRQEWAMYATRGNIVWDQVTSNMSESTNNLMGAEMSSTRLPTRLHFLYFGFHRFLVYSQVPPMPFSCQILTTVIAFNISPFQKLFFRMRRVRSCVAPPQDVVRVVISRRVFEESVLTHECFVPAPSPCTFRVCGVSCRRRGRSRCSTFFPGRRHGLGIQASRVRGAEDQRPGRRAHTPFAVSKLNAEMQWSNT